MKEDSAFTSTLKTFHRLFDKPVLTVRSPGRVNIIGEHTDYNDGFVLPAAINKACYASVGKKADSVICLYSVEFNQSFESDLSALKPVNMGWPNYILGVADQLIKRGYEITGFNLVLNGDVPIGAGLSSSAAVECATAFALDELFQLNISKKELAEIAQKAEHTFPGVRCGIMDQFASIFGKKDHAIKLDCRSLEYEYVPLKLEEYKIVLFNTNVKHSLASSEYNNRRMECEKGVEMVNKHVAAVQSLRDVTSSMLDQYVKTVDTLIFRRCKYVVEENIRLLAGCEDLKHGNLEALGQKMFATHYGLSKDYEVSCKELDFLVDFVKDKKEVIGARMMGGGFGGCTINLIREDQIEDIIMSVSKAYSEMMNKELTTYTAQTEDGTSEIKING